MKCQVKLFGVFRQGLEKDTLSVEIAENSSVSEVFKQLEDSFAQERYRKLLQTSVLATEARVLKPDDMIEPNSSLALLPPVCGG